MSAKKTWAAVAVVAAVAAVTARLSLPAMAGNQERKNAKDTRVEPMSGKEATIDGQVVDLHCFMTGKYMSADHAKCTADCIRAGVPTAIETPQGLVLVSEGARSASAKLVPFALQRVEAKGRLYEKNGVRYLDMESVKSLAPTAETPKAATEKHHTSSRK